MKDQVETDAWVFSTSASMSSAAGELSKPSWRQPLENQLDTAWFYLWENQRTKLRKPWNLLKRLRGSSLSPSLQGEERKGGWKCSTWNSKWGHLFMNSMWDFLWEGYSVIRKPTLVPPTQNLSNHSFRISSWTGCWGGWLEFSEG